MQQWIMTIDAKEPKDVDKITRLVREAVKMGLSYKVRSREIQEAAKPHD